LPEFGLDENILCGCAFLAPFPRTGCGGAIEGGSSANPFVLGKYLRYAYATPGNYNITLRAYDETSNVGEATQNFNIGNVAPPNLAPVAILNCSSPSPLTISCDPWMSYDPDGFIINYEFRVGSDGEFTSDTNFEYFSVSNPGDYEITLRVTDNLGLQATSDPITVHVEENQAPIAMISCLVPDEVNNPFTVECDTSASIDNDGTIEQRTIDWGDGTVEGIYAFTSHTYVTGGPKLISLTVRDNLNAEGSADFSVNLNAPPVAAFTCFHIKALTVKCDASASTDDGNIVSYSWNLGGILKTGAVVTQEFLQEESIIISLTVTDNLGLISSQDQYFDVQLDPDIKLPIAGFEHSVHSDKIVHFDASESLFAGRIITSYVWDFGDGETLVATQPTVDHTYANFGTFIATLKTINQHGVESHLASIQLVVHTPAVSDPGDLGEQSLAGIDTNANGLRDDVERFIDEYFQDNSNKRQAMQQAALTLDQIVKSNADTTIATPLFAQLALDTRCLISQFQEPTDDWSSFLAMLKQKTFNTEARINVYLSLDRAMNIGAVEAIEQTDEQYASNCNFAITP